jgi:diaminohydroxyphosphoribosylaminopyrimidine deaminase/5-amino-6-(5-phosphoribosylamino)uracil reductase
MDLIVGGKWIGVQDRDIEGPMLTPHPLLPAWQNGMQEALALASRFRGATSPNPPVGAAGIDAEGRLIGVAAHERAGTPHAEAKLISELKASGRVSELDTLIVTLEPCNHQGRTPPCTEAILSTPAKRVIYGVSDPNPKVEGGGAGRLKQAGLEVHLANDPGCRALLAPFSKWVTTGRPYVTVKTVWRKSESGDLTMVPPPGQKTFSSPTSLTLAHELRKRADAILSGSGTVLSDRPSFTVRHIPDHASKKRVLAILDRSGRVSPDWLKSREDDGFSLIPEKLARSGDFEQVFAFLGAQGVLEVLVEAGPRLSGAILNSGLWDEHVRITVSAGNKDQVEYVYRNY